MFRPSAILICIVTALAGCRPTRLDEVEEAVARQFADVSSVTTGELATTLDDPHRSPLVLDVRTAEEFAVSHLPGARPVNPNHDPAAQLADVECTRPIVVYCAVGYRSAEFAEKLHRAGYFNVYNLRGSIFRWAAENRPLVNAAGPTRFVHPYDDTWGTLLPADRRSTVPR